MANVGHIDVSISVDYTQLRRAERDIVRSNRRMSRSFDVLGQAATAALSLNAARAAVMMADNMTRLRGRVEALTETTQEANRAFEEMIAIADRVGTPITNIATSFSRFLVVKDQIGGTNDEILQFTETLIQLGIISGATGAEMRGTMVQISQAMANDFATAGQEINSILEQMPALAKTVGAALDLTEGSLKDWSKAGELAGGRFFKAVLAAGKGTQAQFDKLPQTVERSWNRVANSANVALDTLNRTHGVTRDISDTMLFVAETIDTLPYKMDGVFIAATAWKGAFVEVKNVIADLLPPNILSSMEKVIQQYTGRVAKTMARLRNPPGADRDREIASIDAAMEENLFDESGGALRNLPTSEGKRRINITKGDIPPKRTTPDSGAKNRLDKQASSFEQLTMQLATESELMVLLHQEREDAITALTTKGLSERADLYQRNDEKLLADQNTMEANRQRINLEAAEERSAALARIRQDELAQERQVNALKTSAQMEYANAALALLQAGSGKSKAMAAAAFVAQKAIAVAQIMVATQTGSAMALALGPAGIPIAAAIEAKGFASMALVAATSVLQMAGGRRHGGHVGAGRMHPVNEDGQPELLVRGGQQFLLPGNKDGHVTPLKQGGVEGRPPSVTIINNGTPMQVTQTSITRDEVVVMVQDAEDAAVSRINLGLSTGRGATADAFGVGFSAPRNLRGG